ncbi:hypothetical protein B9Z19DRAFT_1121009 [Tuber borchii]|uniref:Uncharacterized protein n=1 Tax=Tuber borchii TaxID=42251 RepID=A0A2T7A3C4_TUBBO|nr:hypothetical protein B9Z19DRAFT_1121009 [Tuber borchii]
MLFENLTQIMNEHFENNVAPPSSLPSSPPISPKPSTPNNSTSSPLSEQSTEIDTPIIERDPSPIPTPAQWRRVKEVQEAAKVLTDISHPMKHLTLNQTPDPYLAAQSVQNTLWSHTPVVTASRLTRLWTYLDAITLNLYSDQSAMQMEDFITTLSAVEWAEGDSNPETCDASTFNSGHAYITQTYLQFTELLKRHTTMRGKMFLENVRNVAPRLYIGSYNNLRLVAKKHFPDEDVIYRSPYPVDSWRVLLVCVLYL